jgi:hypothetical protein
VTEAYLSRSGLLTCYEYLLDSTVTDEWRAALLKEVFDHIDAQGRLLARAGNIIAGSGRSGDAEAKAVLAELRKALTTSRLPQNQEDGE